MNSQEPIHPNDRELSDFSNGKLNDRESEAVNDHLSSCGVSVQSGRGVIGQFSRSPPRGGCAIGAFAARSERDQRVCTGPWSASPAQSPDRDSAAGSVRSS